MKNRVFEIAVLVGSLVSAFLFAALPAYNARHEEIQFPCGRGEALVCQSPNEIFASVFFSIFPLAAACYLIAFMLVRYSIKKQVLRWAATSAVGTIVSVLVYSLFNNPENSFSDWNRLKGYIIWTLLVVIFMIPFMAIPWATALIYEHLRRPKYA